MKTYLIIVLLLVSGKVFAWSPFGPNNYDDCVLENIKGAQNPQAVAAVKQSCSKKFKSTAPPELYDCNSVSLNDFRKAVKEYENLSDDELLNIIKKNDSFLYEKGILCRVSK